MEHRQFIEKYGQDMPEIRNTQFAGVDGLRRGAYVLADASNDKPDIILIATESEVSLIAEACQKLTGTEK